MVNLMTTDIKEAGAFALYQAENGYRVEELRKREDADAAIAADFETYKSRYLRKFDDIAESFAKLGLNITRAA